MSNFLLPVAAVWNYRSFIRATIVSEFKGRFARSYLGGAWSILHPLLQAAIFTVVLSKLMAARIQGVDMEAAFAIYLLAGLAAWSLFTEILQRCVTIFTDYGPVLKKISFPRLCLPIVVLGGAILNQVMLLLSIAVILIVLGHPPSTSWFMLPALIVVITTVAFGFGILLGVFNVFIRDIGQAMVPVTQVWFWLTPIVYPVEIVPDSFRWFIEANPITPLVMAYQNVILKNTAPSLETLLPAIGLGLVLSLLSLYLFRAASSDIVDSI